MAKAGRPEGTKKTELPYLTDQQLGAFKKALEKAKNIRDEVFFKLTLYAGLRVVEATHLKIEDIKPDVFGFEVGGAKGGRTNTYKKIHPRLWSKLKKWLKLREKLPYAKSNPYLFPSKSLYDRPITEQAMKMTFKNYAKKAGLNNGFSIHSLRHTCGIQHAKAKESPIEIMLWLRHRALSSTMVYFEQVQFEDQGEKANATFDRFL